MDECVKGGIIRIEKGFCDGAMILLERNILYGEVGNMDFWRIPRSREMKAGSLINSLRS